MVMTSMVLIKPYYYLYTGKKQIRSDEHALAGKPTQVFDGHMLKCFLDLCLITGKNKIMCCQTILTCHLTSNDPVRWSTVSRIKLLNII